MTRKGMQSVNEDGDRLYKIAYDTDTAFTFRFKGHKYGWAVATYHMCNGTGCLEDFYFLADFERRRLYAFVTMAVPLYHNYFGDVNHDGQLDVLIPDYFYYEGSQLPRSDTIEYLALTPYTWDKAGSMQAIREGGRDCQYVLRFKASEYEAHDLLVLGSYGSFWR